MIQHLTILLYVGQLVGASVLLRAALLPLVRCWNDAGVALGGDKVGEAQRHTVFKIPL